MDNKGLLAIIAVLLISFFFILAMEPDHGRQSEHVPGADNDIAADPLSLQAASTAASYESP